VGRRLVYRKGYLGLVPVHLVVADLNDPEIKIGVMVAKGGIGTRESFASMVTRARPAAAITGTFFGLRNSLPTGDLVVNGRAIYQGFVGTALAFTEGNVVSFIPTRYKEKPAWRLFDSVMRGGPRLVQEGRIAVGPRKEGFRSLSPVRQTTAHGRRHHARAKAAVVGRGAAGLALAVGQTDARVGDVPRGRHGRRQLDRSLLPGTNDCAPHPAAHQPARRLRVPGPVPAGQEQLPRPPEARNGKGAGATADHGPAGGAGGNDSDGRRSRTALGEGTA
jgi:hypothetical protein